MAITTFREETLPKECVREMLDAMVLAGDDVPYHGTLRVKQKLIEIGKRHGVISKKSKYTQCSYHRIHTQLTPYTFNLTIKSGNGHYYVCAMISPNLLD